MASLSWLAGFHGPLAYIDIGLTHSRSEVSPISQLRVFL
jgi:hypothetical protein